MQLAHFQLAKGIADMFAPLPKVEAVALGGSRRTGSGAWDNRSDVDLYVYTRGDIPLGARIAIVEHTGGASQASLNTGYWGPTDAWVSAPTGIEIDVMYFDADWIEVQISRVVDKHQASLGYTTCFWHTVRQSLIFYDPNRWFAELQQRCQVEYPESLRRNIITFNHPVLRSIIPALGNQIEKATSRRDLVSINHRLAALLASYFDILFAVNRQLHPGEKRLLEFAVNNCKLLPEDMESDVASVLLLTAGGISRLPSRVTRLLDRLDELLEREGLVARA